MEARVEDVIKPIKRVSIDATEEMIECTKNKSSTTKSIKTTQMKQNARSVRMIEVIGDAVEYAIKNNVKRKTRTSKSSNDKKDIVEAVEEAVEESKKASTREERHRRAVRRR